MITKKYTHLLTLTLSLISPCALYSTITTNNNNEDRRVKFFTTYNTLKQATDQNHPLDDILKELQLDKEAVLAANDQHGRTFLQCAAFKGHLKVAKLLITLGASVNEKSACNSAPLCHAAMGNHVEMANFLIASDADIDAQDATGSSPLHYAIGCYDGIGMMQLLLSKGANKGLKDKYGQSPLHFAITNTFENKNHPVFAAFLQDKTIDVNTKDEDGNTALHLAALKELPLFIQTLLEHPSVRLDIQNKNGKTALDLAKDTGNDECVSLLKKK